LWRNLQTLINSGVFALELLQSLSHILANGYPLGVLGLVLVPHGLIRRGLGLPLTTGGIDMALGMHQRRVGRISHGCNISNILLSGDDLLSLNELLSVVDGPHDVIISGLLHHVGRCRLQTRDNLPILTLG
jgi:hypothetical protein